MLLLAINIVGAAWAISHYDIGTGPASFAVVVGVAAGAIVQRIGFGATGGWRARFEPTVAFAFLIGFDLTLALAVLLRPA